MSTWTPITLIADDVKIEPIDRELYSAPVYDGFNVLLAIKLSRTPPPEWIDAFDGPDQHTCFEYDPEIEMVTTPASLHSIEDAVDSLMGRVALANEVYQNGHLRHVRADQRAQMRIDAAIDLALTKVRKKLTEPEE